MDLRLIISLLMMTIVLIDSSCVNLTTAVSSITYICDGDLVNPLAVLPNTVEILRLVKATLPSLSFIQQLPRLKTLELNSVTFSDSEPQWSSLRSLKDRLENLRVIHTELSTLEFLELGDQLKWEELEELTFQNTGLAMITASQISEVFLPELKRLNLDHNRISSLDFTLRTADHKLESVSAANNTIQQTTALEYKYLSALKFLNLSNNQLSNGSMLVEVSNALESVDLSGNRLPSFTMTMSTLTMRLTRVNLAYNQLSTLSIPNGQNLMELNLAGNRQLTWSSIEPVLNGTKGLKYLNLSSTMINQINLYNFRDLETLDLSQNPRLFDTNNTRLYLNLNLNLPASGLNLPALHTLSLQNTGIQGMDEFVCKIQLVGLRNLDLSSNPVKSLQFLERLPALRTLDLSNIPSSNGNMRDICMEADLVPNKILEISISPADLQFLNEVGCTCEDRCGQWRALLSRLQPKNICAAVTSDDLTCINRIGISGWECNMETLCSPAVSFPVEVASRDVFHDLYPLEKVVLVIGYGLALVTLLVVIYKYTEYRRLTKGVINNRSILADSDLSSISDLESSDLKRRSRCPTPNPLHSEDSAILKHEIADTSAFGAKKSKSKSTKAIKNKAPSIKKAANVYKINPLTIYDHSLSRSRSPSMSPCYIPSYTSDDPNYATTSPLARRAVLSFFRKPIRRSRSLTELNGPTSNDNHIRVPSSAECLLNHMPLTGTYDYADRPIPVPHFGLERAFSHSMQSSGYPMYHQSLRTGLPRNSSQYSPFASRKKFYHTPNTKPVLY